MQLSRDIYLRWLRHILMSYTKTGMPVIDIHTSAKELHGLSVVDLKATTPHNIFTSVKIMGPLVWLLYSK